MLAHISSRVLNVSMHNATSANTTSSATSARPHHSLRCRATRSLRSNGLNAKARTSLEQATSAKTGFELRLEH